MVLYPITPIIMAIGGWTMYLVSLVKIIGEYHAQVQIMQAIEWIGFGGVGLLQLIIAKIQAMV